MPMDESDNFWKAHRTIHSVKSFALVHAALNGTPMPWEKIAYKKFIRCLKSTRKYSEWGAHITKIRESFGILSNPELGLLQQSPLQEHALSSIMSLPNLQGGGAIGDSFSPRQQQEAEPKATKCAIF
ncbi:hypothetical protein O6H91_04G053600 [Diphasiastrum complanatum]|uniref:Uncharacterized protein n=1 Tax=Diphasiastrum complanatum TaxID=34168 RepID=A0ACC2DWY6_DIPCM|nr:hypothetical protein O6H91_04G053600 [Diphasiastrum complanatum]